jgi:hypothetical protein
MRSPDLALALMALCSVTAGADDLKVIKLEQDVRNLERTVQDLSRQIADLKLQLALTGARPGPGAAPAPRTDGWLVAANWQRLSEGMSEKEVLAILGPPTSARPEAGARVLFYAMEVGPEAILAGHVTLREQRVTEIVAPRLR